MALFAVFCTDAAGKLDQRTAIRPQHREYLATQAHLIRLAGPTMDEAGLMNGSLFVIEVDDRAGAEAFSAGDPFTRKGVFGKVEIRPFTPTMGALS
jgi:uncharacterized protein YciI